LYLWTDNLFLRISVQFFWVFINWYSVGKFLEYSNWKNELDYS
jgi:hypothetical protein